MAPDRGHLVRPRAGGNTLTLKGGSDQSSQKVNCNMVMVGHVDAGKSTISGHLLYSFGQLDDRTLDKFTKESTAMGRASWKFAWAMDLTAEEREKGKTHEVGQAYFESENRKYTLLDAPGHRGYVPSMIAGAALAEVAVLIISARTGEFEAGFEKGGQTREHAILIRSTGVRHLIVAVNKMDECSWSKERYDDIVGKLQPFFKSIGYGLSEVVFLPLDGLHGVNLKSRMGPDVCSWYDGPSLIEALDTVKLVKSQPSLPVRFQVSCAYRETDVYLLGKLECGVIRAGEELLLLPDNSVITITQIFFESTSVEESSAGDILRLKVKGCTEDVPAGSILSPSKGVGRAKATRCIEVKVNILDCKSIIAAGYSCMFHCHSIATDCTWESVISVIDKQLGEVKRPFVRRGQSAVLRLEFSSEICVETYKDFSQLGRFVLREDGLTIGIGIVLNLL